MPSKIDNYIFKKKLHLIVVFLCFTNKIFYKIVLNNEPKNCLNFTSYF